MRIEVMWTAPDVDGDRLQLQVDALRASVPSKDVDIDACHDRVCRVVCTIVAVHVCVRVH